MQAIGPYQLVGELGRGGLGVVYRARDARTGEQVALKVLVAAGAADSPARRRFLREGHALARLGHPGVVRVREVGEHQGFPFLVMDLVEGESLQARIGRGGPLPPAEAAALGLGLARALVEVHRCGLIHRDLKPSNVLLGRDGVPRLVDFGLVRDLDPAGSVLSRTGQFLGTPGYWPPEQATGQLDRVGPASDVYGLGATLYAALTGRAPFVCDSLVAHLQEVEHAPPTPPSRLRPGLDPELEEIVLRCLEKDPARRWLDAEALARALEGWLSRGRARARSRSGVRRALVGAGILAALLLAGVLAALRARRAAATAPTAPVASPAAAPASARRPELDPEFLAVRARERADQDDLQGALLDLDQGLALAPGNAELLRQRARVRLRLSRFPEAEADATRAISLAPEAAEAHRVRAEARLYLDRPEEALADAEAAVARDPGAESQLVLARIFSLPRFGRVADAEAACDRALEADPDSAPALARRGRLRAGRGALPEARVDLDRAVALAPRFAPFLVERAELLAEMRDEAGARADVDAAVALAPRDPAVVCAAAMLLATLDGPTGRTALLDLGLELDPRALPLLRARVIQRLNRGDRILALGDADRLVRFSEGDALALALRAEARRQVRDPERAIEDATAALELDPSLARAWITRGQARLDGGDAAGAGEDARQALAREPDLAEALLLTAEVATAQGRLEEAEGVYGILLARTGDHPDLLLQRARLRDERGDHAGALADLGRTIELAPERWEPWMARASLRYRTKAFAGAVDDATAAIERRPDLADGWFYRAVARQALEGPDGDLALVEADAAKAVELPSRELMPELRQAVLENVRKKRAGGTE